LTRTRDERSQVRAREVKATTTPLLAQYAAWWIPTEAANDATFTMAESPLATPRNARGTPKDAGEVDIHHGGQSWSVVSLAAFDRWLGVVHQPVERAVSADASKYASTELADVTSAGDLGVPTR